MQYFLMETTSLEERMRNKCEELTSLSVVTTEMSAPGDVMLKENNLGKEISQFKVPKSTINYLFDQLNEETKGGCSKSNNSCKFLLLD